jgi:hypothetical protein
MSLALPHDRARRLRTAGWTLLTLLFLLSVPLLLNASPWTRAAAFLLGGGVVAAFSSLLVPVCDASLRHGAGRIGRGVHAGRHDQRAGAPRHRGRDYRQARATCPARKTGGTSVQDIRGHNKAACALANKLARRLWAMEHHGMPFDPRHVSERPHAT